MVKACINKKCNYVDITGETYVSYGWACAGNGKRLGMAGNGKGKRSEYKGNYDQTAE